MASQLLKDLKSAEMIHLSGGQIAFKRSTGARTPRGIDSKVSLNEGSWGLAEQLANGQPLESVELLALN